MTGKQILTVSAILLLINPSVLRSPADEARTTRGATWITSLQANDIDVQKNASAEADAERKQEVGVLSLTLKEDPSKENRVRIAEAMRIAGRLRVKEVAQDIVARIDFLEHGVRLTRRPPSPLDYLAVKSLVGIGKPAVAPIVQRLSTESDPLIRLLCLSVLEQIEGRESAKLILRGEIGRRKGDARTNLENALRSIQ